MSKVAGIRTALKRHSSTVARPVRAVPRSSPCSHCQTRTFLTRRSTSFWSHSYSPEPVPQVPFIPPIPSIPAHASSSRRPGVPILIDHGEAGVEIEGRPIPGAADDGRKKERKERYLDSLMDKAGELSLRCKLEMNRMYRLESVLI